MTRFSICLLACAVPVHCSAQAPTLRPDAVEQKLTALKKAFVSECDAASKELLEAIKTSSTTAMEAGDLYRHTIMERERDDFEKQNLLPKDLSVSTARDEYVRRFQRAKQDCVEKCEEVVADCTRGGEALRAAAVRDELELWKKRLSEKKTPTTRYVPGRVPPAAKKWEENHHYYMFVRRRNIGWQEAKKQCEEMGGRLACAETPSERDFLKSLSVHAWTGGRRFEEGPHQGKWVWLSGVSLDRAPSGSDREKGFASTDPAGLIARPEDGKRAQGVQGYICEWDDESIW